ncbi:fused MFS/spermidine synthase [Nioella nitratireducens]|uniref:fused MFS/spermidine synthase n=1 Tax=Nioella nitratireducens TaxID=1287720 RepID=UPI0008FD70C0|nr:fused MFS/spermidine synthase [Nioella nitratireducens]
MAMISIAQAPRGTAPRWVAVLFTVTIFLSAGLLFFVQPLFTRIVLPQIGGAAAVWTTAMLFFQSVLIAGYLYAHLSTRFLPVRAQVGLHMALWAAALLMLPLSIPPLWRYDPEGATVLQTLGLFARGVGLPFAVLSANAPLIQSWYARASGPRAADPYFLYGASNLGSLLALLAFPLVAAPLFGAHAIGIGWAAGFTLLGAGLLATGLIAGRGPPARAMPRRTALPPPGRIALWLGLAFLPSSLMLSVTTKISTDVGAVPLVWVGPLALYLLSFVLTFSRRPRFPRAVQGGLLIAGVFTLGLILSDLPLTTLTLPMMAALVAGFFCVALKAHQMLYDTRPGAEHLTLFYITLSVGGALGGLVNSVLAPALFNDLVEGRLAVILAAGLVFVTGRPPQPKDGFKGMILGLFALSPVILAAQRPGLLPLSVMLAATAALFLVALILARRSALSAMIVTGIVVLAGAHIAKGPTLFRDRSFFGTHRVAEEDGLRLYANGTTVHGAQRLSDFGPGQRPTPLYYYYPDGPMAQVLTAPYGRRARSVGIVGLGVGSLACYRRPGQDWQFYEIDAMVDRIARDPSLFTFLSTCAPDAPTHLGDARVVLDAQTDARFDILVIDAYSSDAVPVHLTTVEALQLYRDRLAPGGLLLFHISNRYYAIDRPLGRAAGALGLAARIQTYGQHRALAPGDTPSLVVIMAEDAATLDTALGTAPPWQALSPDLGPLWTDDYANPLAILHR